MFWVDDNCVHGWPRLSEFVCDIVVWVSEVGPTTIDDSQNDKRTGTGNIDCCDDAVSVNVTAVHAGRIGFNMGCLMWNNIWWSLMF